MAKYDKYLENIKQEEAFIKEQQRLHKKHSSIDKSKVIVEKANTTKYLLLFIRISVKSIAAAFLICFAAIGIITLIYPGIRAEFLKVILEIFSKGKKMI